VQQPHCFQTSQQAGGISYCLDGGRKGSGSCGNRVPWQLVNPQVEAALIAGVVSLISLSGTVVVAVIGFRTTKRATGSTLAEQRTQTLNQRFATAAEQLGSDKPPAVRLAGVYAMAGLADDWQENRQTCVDVLCAYLRMPYGPDPGQDAPESMQLAYRADREVCHTIIRVITAHLKDDAMVSWQGLVFDFWGVVFDGGDFSGAKFSGGKVDFHRAKFVGGEVFFVGAAFAGSDVSFTGAEFCGSAVNFNMTVFSGGTVNFTNAVFSGGTVEFTQAACSGGTIGFSGAVFSGSQVSFNGATFGGVTVYFSGAQFSGGRVDFAVLLSADKVCFDGATFSGGEIGFAGSMFLGGTADFTGAGFSGGIVDFTSAKFSGSTLDFSDPVDWSFPPRFPWTGPPPTSVRLPQMKDRSQA
jgi:uncharacterized protein YjbI with pentapeptide repeats